MAVTSYAPKNRHRPAQLNRCANHYGSYFPPSTYQQPCPTHMPAQQLYDFTNEAWASAVTGYHECSEVSLLKVYDRKLFRWAIVIKGTGFIITWASYGVRIVLLFLDKVTLSPLAAPRLGEQCCDSVIAYCSVLGLVDSWRCDFAAAVFSFSIQHWWTTSWMDFQHLPTSNPTIHTDRGSRIILSFVFCLNSWWE